MAWNVQNCKNLHILKLKSARIRQFCYFNRECGGGGCTMSNWSRDCRALKLVVNTKKCHWGWEVKQIFMGEGAFAPRPSKYVKQLSIKRSLLAPFRSCRLFTDIKPPCWKCSCPLKNVAVHISTVVYFPFTIDVCWLLAGHQRAVFTVAGNDPNEPRNQRKKL